MEAANIGAASWLFEQAALSLIREMPVNAVARIVGVTDKKLWRVVQHYVAKALAQFDLSSVKAVGLDETASKRGHNDVTVFIDMEKRKEPVLFVTAGKGKKTVKAFAQFMSSHKGDPSHVLGSGVRHVTGLSERIKEPLPNAEVAVDWFHIVQRFTRALDEVSKAEGRDTPLPKHLRWAVLKTGTTDHLTLNQQAALLTLLKTERGTAIAWRIKERLRWIRQASTPRAARWRITRFMTYAKDLTGDRGLLTPVTKALETLRKQSERVVRRWTSTYTNARMEGLNNLFQAARARARGYRNTDTFIAMIVMISSPAGSILKST